MTPEWAGPACGVPHAGGDRVQLGHGSGGRLSKTLLDKHILPVLGNPTLQGLGDGAVVAVRGQEIVLSTDSFVVNPLEFPGGNIGHLAIHGTVNDLAMMGAQPAYMSVGLILEEGLPFSVLDRVLASLGAAAREVGVEIVTGDTKVVERGKADGLFINTTGVGFLDLAFRPAPHRARPGDLILVSGPLGRHGITILEARGDLHFHTELESDTAPLHRMVERLGSALGDGIRVLRDPTRGGLASALNEVASASGVGMTLDEKAIPVPDAVRGACEMLGLDPLYVANEGVLVAVVDPAVQEAALEIMKRDPLGSQACVIGSVGEDHPGMVVVRTPMGNHRILDLLPGDQLPRIC